MIIDPGKYHNKKLNLFEFGSLKDVRLITEELEKVPYDDFDKYVEDNNIEQKLIESYWLHYYNNLDDYNLAQKIMDETFPKYNGNDDEFYELVMRVSTEKGRPDIGSIIMDTCPNGHYVRHRYLQSIKTGKDD